MSLRACRVSIPVLSSYCVLKCRRRLRPTPRNCRRVSTSRKCRPLVWRELEPLDLARLEALLGRLTWWLRMVCESRVEALLCVRPFVSERPSKAVDRLRHMLEAADTIANYASRGRDAFDADPALRDGILYQIVVLGEAARAVFRAEPTLVAEVSEIEWSSRSRGGRYSHVDTSLRCRLTSERTCERIYKSACGAFAIREAVRR